MCFTVYFEITIVGEQKYIRISNVSSDSVLKGNIAIFENQIFHKQFLEYKMSFFSTSLKIFNKLTNDDRYLKFPVPT